MQFELDKMVLTANARVNISEISAILVDDYIQSRYAGVLRTLFL